MDRKSSQMAKHALDRMTDPRRCLGIRKLGRCPQNWPQTLNGPAFEQSANRCPSLSVRRIQDALEVFLRCQIVGIKPQRCPQMLFGNAQMALVHMQ